MDSYQHDPLLQVAKCEMCPKKVSNFVVGLCERCVTIWTNKRSIETMQITIDHVKAAIVSMGQNKTNYQNMHETFRRAIVEEQRKRKLKVDLFQKFREKFQDGVLIPDVKDSSPCEKLELVETFSDVVLPSISMD